MLYENDVLYFYIACYLSNAIYVFILFRKVHCNSAILKCHSMIWQDTVEVSNKVHGDRKYIKSHGLSSIITTMYNVTI